jgi:uncharacterized protein (TIGR00299 family) protein
LKITSKERDEKMKDVLYFEINSGISGDMTIASLLNLGVDKNEFLDELKKLNLEGYEVKISTVQKNGITATDFEVILENDSHHVNHENDDHLKKNHDDNENHNHNHNHNHHDHDHEKQKVFKHTHKNNKEEKSHNHSKHHEHVHRNFDDIKKLINDSKLSEKVKELSINIFEKVAKAEAKVHNKKINEVHFHEVGAVDSIVDIVGTAILIDILNPDQIYSSPVSLGTGFVNVAHGRIPVPAPATIEILKNIPVYSTGVEGELVTPTGAAIIKTLAEEFIIMPELNISKIAYGAGKKDFEITNLLRIYQAKKK